VARLGACLPSFPSSMSPIPRTPTIQGEPYPESCSDSISPIAAPTSHGNSQPDNRVTPFKITISPVFTCFLGER
jgi:hypothetical protein